MVYGINLKPLLTTKRVELGSLKVLAREATGTEISEGDWNGEETRGIRKTIFQVSNDWCLYWGRGNWGMVSSFRELRQGGGRMPRRAPMLHFA